MFCFFLMSVLAVWCPAIIAQTTVTGTVVDAVNNESVIGAAVIQSGTTNGVVTDVDGKFTITLPSAGATLIFKSLGYKELQKRITGTGRQDLGVIALEEDAVALADVTITSSIAVARETPVALTNLSPVFIEERIGVKEFPELLKATPGVTVIRKGGGFGDSELYMRGFKPENVAVMVNGVPMNDMEWGGVYWSNWLGMQDVVRVMQTQRGIGASQVSAPSVGGSVNIVTRTTDIQKGGSISYGIGENGFNKLLFSVSTGLTKNGWAFTLLGGKTWGDGYVQGTEFEGYDYFVNITKRINNVHQLSLTAFGAPQWHNQRNANDGLTIQGWQDVQQYMKPDQNYRYNPTYGFGKNGERKTSSRNEYHKPQISLNHMWDINETSSLSTAVYLSIGNGFGYSGQGSQGYSNSSWYGSTNGKLNWTFRKPDGTFAYDEVQQMNEESTVGSKMVMSVSKNNHKWVGLLSTYKKDLSEQLNIMGGIDGRYYIGTHTNEIIDLYNGSYFIDGSRANVKAENNAAAANPDWKNQKLTVGDVVYRDYDGYVAQIGVFGQGEYKMEKLTATVAGSLNNVSQWRYDRYYYDKDHAKSDVVSKIGYTVKGGANYNLNESHNVFANIGYISRAPFFSGGIFLQSTTSNVVNTDAVNEKIFTVEAGYGFRSRYLSVNLNAYHTEWKDKTMANSITSSATGDRGTINMTGVNATHEGVEVDLIANPLPWLDLNGMVSVGNWRWTNDPVGYFYNSSGQPITKDWTVASGIEAADHAKMKLDLDDVKVGGSAQTTGALGAKFRIDKHIYVGIDWTIVARIYADWSLTSSDIKMDGEKKFETPWRVPTYNTFDLNAGYNFKIGSLNAFLSGNISNLFDQEYVESAYDGSSHDWDTAYRVFYGLGRQMSMRLKVNF